MQSDRIENALSQVSKLYSESSSDNQQNIRDRLALLFNTLNGTSESHTPKERKKHQPPKIPNSEIANYRAYKELEKRDLIRRTHTARLSIAQVIAKHLNINISREERRNKNLLIKWYDDHWDAVAPVLDQLEIIFEENDDNDDQQNIDNTTNNDED